MKYDINLKFTNLFIKELNKKADSIYSVYFGLGGQFGVDARKSPNSDLVTMARMLKKLSPKIKRYVTLNGRHATLDKFSESKLSEITNILVYLSKEKLIDGIFFVDFYYLKALCKINDEFAKNLELIPSINCAIDSIEKILQYNKYINKLKPGYVPSKFILDRSVNRNLKKLKKVSAFIRSNFPDSKIEIIANEGCLLHCPYKINHDVNVSTESDTTLGWSLYKMSINQEYPDIDHEDINESCLQDFSEDPSEIIKSPFIRAEDQKEYDDLVDIIKISGKLKEEKILLSILNQYMKRESTSNLLETLDAPSALKEDYFLRGFDFPKDFIKKVGYCDKDCIECEYCDLIFKTFAAKITD